MADAEARKVQKEATEAARVAHKEAKVKDYFACLSAREQGTAPCPCGAQDSAHCKFKNHKFCASCLTVTASGCTKKKCIQPASAAPAAAPAAATGPSVV